MSKLSKDSIVLAHQVRAVDKQRLVNYVGMITDRNLISDIQEAVKFQLDLQ